jgi:hypothetical protein
MWLRLALRGAVAYRAAPVARYRQHPATISHAASRNGARLRSDARVVRRVLRAERARIGALQLCAPSEGRGVQCSGGSRRLAHRAHTALAAKALLHAGELQARGEPRAALRALALGARLRPGLVHGARAAAADGLLPTAADRPAPLAAAGRATGGGPDERAAAADRRAPLAADERAAALAPLAFATARGDAYTAHRATQALLARLARELGDPAWDALLVRVARTVRTVTPPDAVLGTVTKWDPTLLALSGRRGRNFPDRASLPDGYPADSAAAVAHLEAQRAAGLSHLVFPSASLWWLDHYAGLDARLRAAGPPVHQDDDCVVFDLRAERTAA